MERQRSFSIKPTSLLALLFTVLSSLLFCCLLSFWVLRTTPSASVESRLLLSPALRTIKAQAFNLSADGAKGQILVDTHLLEAANLAGEALDLGQDWKDAIFGGTQVSPSVDSSGEIFGSVSDGENPISSDAHSTGSSQDGLDSVGKRKITDLAGAHLRKSTTSAVGIETKGRDSGVPMVRSEKLEPSGLLGSEQIEWKDARTCDISDGRWVFDESYPLYTSGSCPFIDEGFSCEANGRMDRNYTKWRWQPHHCSIPRFNPVKMLEMIRGKRLVFVGDSINRNQWESMLCLLRGAVSDPSRVYEARGRRITKNKGNYNFKFKDYQCSVEFYVSHFLVHESKARVGKRRVKTLRIDTVDRSSSRWRGADILVFNTAHWWSHYKTKAGVNYYQEGDLVHPRLDVSAAFRKALTTWALWIDRYVVPKKTQVFFRSSAPSHFSGGEWNAGGHCKESTMPLNDTLIRSNPEKNLIVEQVINQMKTPVTILNITSMSGIRIDGHPSVYGRKPGIGPPSKIQDCSHWCLPGVPDTWNELLYFHLYSRQRDQRR